jgi:Tfp pilus assembly protein PilZ
MNPVARPNLICILSGNKEAEKVIADVIGSFGADFIFADTVRDLRDIMYEKACSGLLFPITSMVGLDQSSKSMIQALEQIYPAARIRWDKEKGSIAIIASQNRQVETISDFISTCASFVPRRLRRNERLSKTLNALISLTPDLAASSRAFTLNISPRGCFLHSPCDWNVGDFLYIQIQELTSKSIIKGKVIRKIPWGVPFQVEGIGIQFIDIGKEQIEELQNL